MSVIGYAIAASPLDAPLRAYHFAHTETAGIIAGGWPHQGFGSTEPGQKRAHFVCWFFHDRKSKMVPTAFSTASAIYFKIGGQPADEFVYYPNASLHFRQVAVQLMYIPRGVTSMHHPLGGHLTRRTCRSVAERCKDATLVRCGNKKNAGATWQ
jgi:hypothetical protein